MFYLNLGNLGFHELKYMIKNITNQTFVIRDSMPIFGTSQFYFKFKQVLIGTKKVSRVDTQSYLKQH